MRQATPQSPAGAFKTSGASASAEGGGGDAPPATLPLLRAGADVKPALNAAMNDLAHAAEFYVQVSLIALSSGFGYQMILYRVFTEFWCFVFLCVVIGRRAS